MINQYYNHFRLPGIDTPISIEGSENLLPIIRQLLRDWEIIHTPLLNPASEPIQLKSTAKGYVRSSRWLKKPACFSDPVDAVCDLIVDIIHAYLDNKKDLLCLHCAGVKFDEGLVIFPNTYKTGKSTLSVKLASLGLQLFSDDVIPYSISNMMGEALGILPRLRAPLPNSYDQGFYNYIRAHRGPFSNQYQYIDIPRESLAPKGETCTDKRHYHSGAVRRG